MPFFRLCPRFYEKSEAAPLPHLGKLFGAHAGLDLIAAGKSHIRFRMLIKHFHKQGKAALIGEPVVMMHDLDVLALRAGNRLIPVCDRSFSFLVPVIADSGAGIDAREAVCDKAVLRRPDGRFDAVRLRVIGDDDLVVREQLRQNRVEESCNPLGIFIGRYADGYFGSFQVLIHNYRIPSFLRIFSWARSIRYRRLLRASTARTSGSPSFHGLVEGREYFASSSLHCSAVKSCPFLSR